MSETLAQKAMSQNNSRALRRRIAQIVSDALIASLAQHDIPTLTDAEAWLSRIHNARAVSDTLVAMTLLAVEEGTEAK